MNTKFCVLFVVAFLVTWPCQGSHYQVFPLRMKTGYNEQYPTQVSCASWRLGVEANNLVKWKTVPAPCQEHVADYLLGDQYRSDSKTVCREAFLYAKTLNITDRDIFVFDVDETALSNLQYFANHDFGVEEHNATAFKIWVSYGEAFALPETLKLYNKLLDLGIKVVFITERPLDLKDVTVSNLKNVGFYKWEKLIARDPAIYSGKLSNAFKSSERKKLTEEGFRIVGNIGDQWSDIVGEKRGFRTFKLPNPLYYD